MTYRFLVHVDLPDDWQGPGSIDRSQIETAEGLAAEIREATARVVPGHETEVSVSWNPTLFNRPDVQVDPTNTGSTLARIDRPGELERQDQINIDARGAQVDIHRPAGKRRQARCGNCLERYDIGDDPITNHHLAMQHKLVCRPVGGGAMYSEDQRSRLIDEFNAQAHVVAMRQRFEATGNALPAAAAPQVQARPWYRRLFSWLSR